MKTTSSLNNNLPLSTRAEASESKRNVSLLSQGNDIDDDLLLARDDRRDSVKKRRKNSKRREDNGIIDDGMSDSSEAPLSADALRGHNDSLATINDSLLSNGVGTHQTITRHASSKPVPIIRNDSESTYIITKNNGNNTNNGRSPASVTFSGEASHSGGGVGDVGGSGGGSGNKKVSLFIGKSQVGTGNRLFRSTTSPPGLPVVNLNDRSAFLDEEYGYTPSSNHNTLTTTARSHASAKPKLTSNPTSKDSWDEDAAVLDFNQSNVEQHHQDMVANHKSSSQANSSGTTPAVSPPRRAAALSAILFGGRNRPTQHSTSTGNSPNGEPLGATMATSSAGTSLGSAGGGLTSMIGGMFGGNSNNNHHNNNNVSREGSGGSISSGGSALSNSQQQPQLSLEELANLLQPPMLCSSVPGGYMYKPKGTRLRFLSRPTNFPYENDVFHTTIPEWLKLSIADRERRFTNANSKFPVHSAPWISDAVSDSSNGGGGGQRTNSNNSQQQPNGFDLYLERKSSTLSNASSGTTASTANGGVNQQKVSNNGSDAGGGGSSTSANKMKGGYSCSVKAPITVHDLSNVSSPHYCCVDPSHPLLSKFYIFHGPVTSLALDAVVNAANNACMGGGGVDGAVHKLAGPMLLRECCLFEGCQTGHARLTKGYNLPASLILHTVGPTGGEKPAELASCYNTCLSLCRRNHIRSVGFCCVGTGIYGYPLEKATIVAVNTVTEFMLRHHKDFTHIVFACFTDEEHLAYTTILPQLVRKKFAEAKEAFKSRQKKIEKIKSKESKKGSNKKDDNKTTSPSLAPPKRRLSSQALLMEDKNLRAVSPRTVLMQRQQQQQQRPTPTVGNGPNEDLVAVTPFHARRRGDSSTAAFGGGGELSLEGPSNASFAGSKNGNVSSGRDSFEEGVEDENEQNDFSDKSSFDSDHDNW